MITIDDDVAQSAAAVLAGMDATDALAPQHALTRERAQALGLTIFPAEVPDTDNGDVVEVCPDRMEVVDFVNLAASLDCRLLYVWDEHFYLTDVNLPTIESAASSDTTALRTAAARFDGNLTRLEVAFRFDGVWHRWHAEASCHDPLLDLTDQTGDHHTLLGPRSVDDAELSTAEHERLVQALLDDPEFRGEPRHRRYRVGEEHPLLAPLREADPPKPRAVWRVINDAGERVDQAKDHAARGLRPQLPVLARQLAAATEYRSALSPKMRQQVAAEFLTEHSGGYPMPTALRDEIVKLAATQPPTNTSLF